MSGPGTSTDETSELLPANLAPAGAYPSFTAGSEHGLVILAMGLPYWLVPMEGGYHLLVEADAANHARDQLARYDRESVNWPPQPVPDDAAVRQFEVFVPLVWATVVLLTYVVQMTHPAMADAGLVEPDRIFRHNEWWRPLTATFLHGSSDHVIANALSGLLVFAAVLTTFGRGLGLLLLAVAAFAANVAIAAVHFGDDYRSLGASTVIFAGIGLLTGRALSLAARNRSQRWRRFFVRLAAGLSVVGLYGAGGAVPNVDVGAHATSFLAGAIGGFIATFARRSSTQSP